MASLVRRSTAAVTLREPSDFARLEALARAQDAEYDGFRVRIRIDKHRLDEGLVEQAQVYLDICDRGDNAASILDKAKDDLARKDAELARRYRAELIKANGKTTDSIVNDEVMLDPEHQKFTSVVYAAKKNTDRWRTLAKAFEQRMRMLRELVSSYNSGYWTTSGAHAAGNAARDAAVEKVREARAQRQQQAG